MAAIPSSEIERRPRPRSRRIKNDRRLPRRPLAGACGPYYSPPAYRSPSHKFKRKNTRLRGENRDPRVATVFLPLVPRISLDVSSNVSFQSFCTFTRRPREFFFARRTILWPYSFCHGCLNGSVCSIFSSVFFLFFFRVLLCIFLSAIVSGTRKLVGTRSRCNLLLV